jgi:hypothetical protein
MEWGAAPADSPAVPLPAPEPVAQHGEAIQDNPLPLVQHLPWDFETTFPSPTDGAIENGLIEDDEVDTVRWLHLEHAKEALAVLHERDAVLDARRCGVDPATGKPPRTPTTRERLRKFFETEPARLEQRYQTLMDTYEEAFGAEAREAFDKALRARRAGIPVVAESKSPIVAAPAAPSENREGQHSARTSRRVVARLPVPKPLPSAVAAGHFGQDEHGRNIRPGPQEIREITERHVEKLIDILDSIGHAPQPPSDEIPRLQKLFAGGIHAYCESFGEHAAKQLEAYVRRQVQLRDQPFTASPRGR